MTSSSGNFTSCGPSQEALIQFTCTGPSCVDLDGFPGITCTTDGDTLTCSNGVICSGPTNYTSSFNLSQTNIIVSQTQKLILSDFCEEIDLTADGSTGGTQASYIDTGSCGPGSSNSTTTTTTTTSATSTTSTTTSSTANSSSTTSSTTTSPYTTSITTSPYTTSTTTSPYTTSTTTSPYTTSTTTFPYTTSTISSITSHRVYGGPSTTSSCSNTSDPSQTPPFPESSTSTSTWPMSGFLTWSSISREPFHTNAEWQDVTNCSTTDPSKKKSTTTNSISSQQWSGWSSPTTATTNKPADPTWGDSSKTTSKTSSKTMSKDPSTWGEWTKTTSKDPATLSDWTMSSPTISSKSADPTSWSKWTDPVNPATYTNSWTDDGSPGHGSSVSETYGTSVAPAETSTWADSWDGTVGATTAVAPVSTNIWTDGSASNPVTVNSANTWSTSSSTTSANAPIWSPYKSAATSPRPISLPIFTTLLLIFSVLLQGTFAFDYPANHFTGISKKRLSEPYHRHDFGIFKNHTGFNLYADRALTPGWKEFSDLFSEYLAGKLSNGGEFAENLVDELAEAVCDHATGAIITKALGVDLVEDCVAAIYAANAVTAPEVEFMSVLYASVLCNYLVAEALPGIGALTDAICSQPKPCSEDLLTDPKNCGSCGNVCSTGVCANGACTSNTCTGQTCSTFGPCGPGGNCVCASTSESTGFCVDGSTACDSLAGCNDSGDCGSGEVCAVGTCCSTNVCIGATICGGNATDSGVSKRFLGLKRGEYRNGTIASLGTWIP